MNTRVNKYSLDFSFDDDNKFWNLGEKQSDLFGLGYTTDIIICNEDFNTNEVAFFLEYIFKESFDINEKIRLSNQVLKHLFYGFHKRFEGYEVHFTLGTLEYLGRNENFEYLMGFYVESKSNSDFYTLESWNVCFRGDIMFKAFVD